MAEHADEDAPSHETGWVQGEAAPAPQMIELLEEVVRVAKRTVESGRVRVSVLTDVEERTIRESLASRRVEVEEVDVGRQLSVGEPMPQSRTEGGVLIVPMIEEILVVEKRLVVTKELHIRIVHDTEEATHVVALRRQRAIVERVPSEEPT